MIDDDHMQAANRVSPATGYSSQTAIALRVPQLEGVLDWLQDIAGETLRGSEPPHWIEAINTDADDLDDYCYEHAKLRLDALNADHAVPEYLIRFSSDHSASQACSCADCGKPLIVSFTRHGLVAEMEYFEQAGLSLGGEGREVEAFQLHQILKVAVFADSDLHPRLGRLVERVDCRRRREAAVNARVRSKSRIKAH